MKEAAAKILKLSLFLFLFLSASGLNAAETATTSVPVAVMPETEYNFTNVVDGEYIVHDFIIQNKGDAVLNILKVKTT